MALRILMVLLAWFVSSSLHAEVFEDKEASFSIVEPDNWIDLQLSGRMRWFMIDGESDSDARCSVTVTKDAAFSLISSDEYINGLSQERFIDMASLAYENVKIGMWETDYSLGSQRAIQYVFSGSVENQKLITMTIQTLKKGRLYTFSCAADSSVFVSEYLDMLRIASSFKFTSEPSDDDQPRLKTGAKDI